MEFPYCVVVIRKASAHYTNDNPECRDTVESEFRFKTEEHAMNFAHATVNDHRYIRYTVWHYNQHGQGKMVETTRGY